LAGIAGLPLPMQPRELGIVRSWEGISRDLLVSVFQSVMARPNRPAAPDLTYFVKPVRDAVAGVVVKPASPAASAASPALPPAPALSPAQIAEQEAWLGTAPELAEQWARIRSRLQGEVGEVEYRNWLSGMTLAAVEDGEATVHLPTRFLADWVRTNHAVLISGLWQAENPDIRRVEVRFDDSERSVPPA
jgi:hypothetical protein